uniref:Reverse transcriptase domain-containing protein n=1 Tax=Schistocephalus solidus TaxID=70667 RepID=A0A183TSY5_SCHSO
LFIVYINDCAIELDCDIAMFADDLKLWRVIQTATDEKKLQVNLHRLQKWQMRGDLLQTFRIVKGLDCSLEFSDFFEFAATTHLRGHPLKLRVEQAGLDVRKFSFSVRMV